MIELISITEQTNRLLSYSPRTQSLSLPPDQTRGGPFTSNITQVSLEDVHHVSRSPADDPGPTPVCAERQLISFASDMLNGIGSLE